MERDAKRRVERRRNEKEGKGRREKEERRGLTLTFVWILLDVL